MKDNLSRITSSVSFKFVVIGILSLLLLIPVGMIRNLISERQNRSEEAILEVSQKWGLSQTITGPFLTLPLTDTHIIEGKEVSYRRNLNILPEDLKITGDVKPEEKKRGIYRVIVYQAEMHITGELKISPDLQNQVSNMEVVNEQLYLCLGISDLRGIKDLRIRVGKEVIEEMPGLPTQQVAEKGIHVPLSAEILKMDSVPFDISLELDGSRQLYFIPAGKNTTVALNSSWADPSFDGAFLPIPSETETGEDGFHASWKVNYLNRSYPQSWFDAKKDLEESGFGVHFLIPVDHYQKSMRSIKYALMFIALSFLVFFLTELLSGTRLHPIQYLLVGISLVVFYTLLISLSEHIGFGMAYLVSSIATFVLIGLYVASSTGKRKQGWLTSTLLMVLYAFLFTTLQLQDFSLLFGSVGIFTVMAIIMYVSRKVNWYKEPAVPRES